MHDEVTRKVRGLVLAMNAFAATMLVLIPAWNASVLAWSGVYSQVLSSPAPSVFLTVLFLIIGFYLSIAATFTRAAQSHLRTTQTLVMLVGAILTTLGVAFMLFGHEILRAAEVARHSLEHDCQMHPAFRPLFLEASVLYDLRFRPECAFKLSVEHCDSFQDSSNAQLLKRMEEMFRCSTFCTKMDPPYANYPRSLFSQASYDQSCQMALVRNLEYYVADVGTQAYYQGCLLVISSMAVAFLSLFGLCGAERSAAKPMPATPRQQLRGL